MSISLSCSGVRRLPMRPQSGIGRAIRARRLSISAIMALMGLTLLQAPANAVPMIYNAQYSSGTNVVSTEALFDTATITGVGTEYAPLDYFSMVFSHRGYLQTADIVPSTEPWPDGTLLARYVDGTFNTLWSQDNGGSNRISVSPPANWLGESISLGFNELIDFPCCSGFTKYALISSSGPVPVPEPTTALLLTLGLVGLAAKPGIGSKKRM